MPPVSDGQKILNLKQRVVDSFDQASWTELGLLTGCTDLIEGHGRLLRSLSWGDSDYDGNALNVIMQIIRRDPANQKVIEDYLAGDVSGNTTSASSEQNHGPRIYIQPNAFEVPSSAPDPYLLSAMMPFAASFNGVFACIERAATANGMTVKRADNIWEHSTIIQDIFTLIYRSYIVVCDFSGSNPNVFYETGIAHTLGKHVIPIAQHMSDLPFDLKHHRCIIYLNNKEGLEKLQEALKSRISYLLGYST